VSHRPLVFVSGLTVGDYLLWSWSLGGNHEVLALVSGLTLPPLAVTCLWLLVLGFARLIAHIARRPVGRIAHGAPLRRRARRPSVSAVAPDATTGAASTDTQSPKLAA
jgi:hypothetical protein